MPSLIIESGEWNTNNGLINITMVPLYNISNNPSTNEGTPISIFLTTELVPDNTTLYWSLSRPEDFSVGSGSFIINNNAGSFSLSPTNDFTTEGNETVQVYIRTQNQTGPIVIQTSFLLVDTSLSPTYQIGAPDAFNEGDSIFFNVFTTNVPNGTTLYYTIDGTVSSADFIGSPTLNGSLSIISQAASLGLAATNDVSTEGAETMIFNLRTGSISGPIVATKTVILRDTSQAPSYNISPSQSTVSEGGGIAFNVTTTGVANGTTLYYSVSSTAINDVSPIAGSITISGGTASIPINAVADFTTEGSETFAVSLRSVSTTGPVLAISSLVEILDTSGTPTYSIVPIFINANEGETVTWLVSTTNVPNGTTLYYSNAGTTVGVDFSDGLNAGSFTINSNQGSIVKTLANDFLTEGIETVIMQVRTASTSGPVVASAVSVQINDTSLSPTYSVTPTANNINEGSALTFNVSTTNVPNGTVLYWTVNNISTNAFDFGAISGNFTISSSSGSFSISITADELTEGAETFSVQLRTGSTFGPVVATSSSVTINDTSLTRTYSVAPNITSVNEGNQVTFNVTTTNVPNGTTLYYNNIGTTAAADFTDGQNSGSFTITSNAGSFIRQLSNDLTTEGSETIIIVIRTGSTSGPTVATAATVTVNDTSIQAFSMSVGFVLLGGGGGGGVTTGGGGGGGAFTQGTFTAQSGVTYQMQVGNRGSGGGGYGAPTAGPVGLGTRGLETVAFGGIARGGGGGGGGHVPLLSPGNADGRNAIWRRQGVSVAQGGAGGGGAGAAVGPSQTPGGTGITNGGFGRQDDVVTRPGHIGGGGGGAGASGTGARAQSRGFGGDGGAGISSGVVGPGIIQYCGGGGGGSWGPFFSDRAGFGRNGGGGGSFGFGDGGQGQVGTGGGGGGGGGLGFNNQFRAGGQGGTGAVLINYTNTFPNITTISNLSVSGASPDTTSRPGSKVYRFVSGSPGSITW